MVHGTWSPSGLPRGLNTESSLYKQDLEMPRIRRSKEDDSAGGGKIPKQKSVRRQIRDTKRLLARVSTQNKDYYARLKWQNNYGGSIDVVEYSVNTGRPS